MSLALALGVSFSHLLQAGPKATLLVVLLVRRERPALVATVVSAGAVVAMLLVWAAFVYPIDREVASWTAATLPSDWERYRNQWHLWQAVRTALALVAFGAFAVSLLLERKKGLFGTPY